MIRVHATMTVVGVLCLATFVPAQPARDQSVSLLKTFRNEFVPITPAMGAFPQTYLMGTPKGPFTEEPAHEVTFLYSFSMAKYEVPQNLYEHLMGSNPSKWKGPRNSAEMFTYADAVKFCKTATERMRAEKLITAEEEIRLPTEAEWEYCCRAGTSTAYSFGDSAIGPGDSGDKASLLGAYGWHTGNAAGNDPPVGALKPNPWGLYDMHGYLWEFVSDAWHETYDGAPGDGKAWTSDDPKTRRVVRGGSWKERHECHRSAYRRPVRADEASDAIGFRCVLAKVKQP